MASRVEMGRHPRPIIKRSGEIFIWSRGEDLATDKFPELHPFLNALPDGTVSMVRY
jgi:hypothetical protein